MLKRIIFTLITIIPISFLGNDDSLSIFKKQLLDEKIPSEKFQVLEKIVEHYKNFEADSALHYAYLQLSISEKQNDNDLIAIATSNLAKIYLLKGDYTKAIENAVAARNLFEKLVDVKGQIKMITIIGQIHGARKEFDECFEIYNKGLDLAEENPKFLLPLYIGIGNAYFLQENLTKAEEYFLKCLEITNQENDIEFEKIATIYTNLGNVQTGVDKDKKAIVYYKKSLEIYSQLNDKFGMSLLTFNIGDSYMFMGQYDSSEYYFKLNLKLGEELKSFEEIYYAYFGLTNLYTEQKKYEKALVYQKLSSKYKDSILKHKYDKSVLEIEKKYEYENQLKKIEITQLEFSKAKENEKRDALIIKRDNVIIMYLWIGAIILLAISILILYFYYKVKKSNILIREQHEKIIEYNKSLDKTLQQKEVLLKEVHHRVKNNLQIIASLLNLQAIKTDNEIAKQAIEDSKNRVQAIALMHKGLYQDEHYNKVDMSVYIQELVNNHKLFSMDHSQVIDFKLTLENIIVNIDSSVPIGLIISELISNSLKHAFTEKIENPCVEIKVSLVDNLVKIVFRDNGKGMPENFKIESTETLGFEVITSLIEQINGTIEITTHRPLQITILFPYKA